MLLTMSWGSPSDGGGDQGRSVWTPEEEQLLWQPPLTQQCGRAGGAGPMLCSRPKDAHGVMSHARDTEPEQAEGAGSSSRLRTITSLAQAACRAEPSQTLTVTPQHTSCGLKSPKPRKITGTIRVSAGRPGRHFQVLA